MLKFENVQFRYENSCENSISSVDFNVNKGEFVVITGKSGSGKSTITRCINGLIPKFYTGEYSGNILIDSKDIKDTLIHEISYKVGSVFQDPRSQFFTTDTLSELAFTCENFGMNSDEIGNRIHESANIMDITNLLNKNLFELSSGEKQKIAIASVHTLKPKIFVLDEPSSNLDCEGIENLKRLLMILKKEGYTIIISEHRLYYLRDLIDKVIYFENGILSEKFTKNEFLKLNEMELSKRGLRNTNFSNKKLNKKEKEHENEYVLNVSGLDFYYDKRKQLLKNISFDCRKGEIIGFIGNNGAGKTTLGRVIAGIYKPKNGAVFLNSKKLNEKKRRKKISFVMQDADYQLFTESVEKELLIGNEKIDNIDQKIENALNYMDLGLLKENHPAALSGGQKQRITIALSMVKDSDLVIMDEPTSGLDRMNMDRVCNMVKDLASMGKTIILITHDYEFILNSCSRVMYLKDGEINKDFNLENQDMLDKCFQDMRRNNIGK